MLGNMAGAEEGRALGEVGSRVQLSRERSGDGLGWAGLISWFVFMDGTGPGGGVGGRGRGRVHVCVCTHVRTQ